MKLTINFFFLLLNLFTVSNLLGQDAKLSGSKSLGNIEIKNYSNKFLERPESVWSVIRSNKSKKVYFGTYGGILEYDGKNVCCSRQPTTNSEFHKYESSQVYIFRKENKRLFKTITYI